MAGGSMKGYVAAGLQTGRLRPVAAAGVLIALVLAGSVRPGAQGQQGAAPASQPPATPRARAPIDLTGYWVSIVNEDWRWRMVTPPKGDAASVPLNAEGTKVTNAWDPATAASRTRPTWWNTATSPPSSATASPTP